MKFNPTRMSIASRTAVVFAMAFAMISLMVSETSAQRGRGGGGRAGGGRSSGGYRPPTQSHSRSPSHSRTTTPNRSQTTNRSSNRSDPNRGGTRVGTGGNRTKAVNQAGQGKRASKSDLSNFLNISGGGSNRAAGGSTTRAAGGNQAVSDFLNHNSGGSVANNRADNISNRTDTRSNVRDSRGENRDFASDNRQGRVSDRGDRQAVRVSTRGETRSSLAAGRGENRSQRQQKRSDHADSIRDALENEFDDNHLFDDFWKNNPDAYYRFNQNPVFWTWATAATVGTFLGGGYSSGGGEMYYEEGTVYSGDEQIPEDEYAEQAEQIVEGAPEVENPDDMEWLPLGVFALADENASDVAPTMFLQLAVSKEGVIAGTFNNKSTDETKSVEGAVDMKTGRAAWTIAGKSTPIMETKLESLTANETNALIHFADGKTQQWLMLHIENKEDDQK